MPWPSSAPEAVRIYPIFIPQAGCRQRCIFCRQQGTSGRIAPPSPAEVALALEQMLPAHGDGEVAFYGGSFTLLSAERQRAYLELVRPCRNQGRVAGIRISTRPDALDAATVSALRELGVTTVEIGCQSFSPLVLQRSGRGHTPEAAAAAVARLRAAGLAVGLQLMPGLPGGDDTEARASLEAALQLRPDFLRIYPTVVIRDTPLESLWRRGDYRPLDLDAAVSLCAELLLRCRQVGVPVIRFGLQGTSDLDSGAAWVAGPYHPAFGQLVRSRLWLWALRRALQEHGDRKVHLHPADLADAIGHRRANLAALEPEFGPVTLQKDAARPRETLQVAGVDYDLSELCDRG